MSKNSSTIGEIIGDLLASRLQRAFASNEKLVSAFKAMHLTNLQGAVRSFEWRKSSADGNVSASYSSCLRFEGRDITPNMRDWLFVLCLRAQDYDDLTPSMKRLAWWILDHNPYENVVPSPEPPEVRRTPGLMHLHIGMAVSIVIVLLVMSRFSASDLYPVVVILILSYIVTLWRIQRRKERVVDEWAWLAEVSDMP